MPSRKLLDDFLEEGAVAGSQKTAMKHKPSVSKPHAATSMGDRPTLHTEPTATAADNSDQGSTTSDKARPINGSTNQRKLGPDDEGTQITDRSDERKAGKLKRPSGLAVGKDITAKKDNKQSRSAAATVPTQPPRQSEKSATGVDKVANKASSREGAVRDSNTMVSSGGNVVVETRAKPNSGSAERSHQPNDNSSRRPQRQAKQTALDKLKASQKDSDADFDFDSAGNSGKDASRAKQQRVDVESTTKQSGPVKQLPRPITNVSKGPQSSFQGKLKPVKPRSALATEKTAKATLASGGNREQTAESPKATTTRQASWSSSQDELETSNSDEEGPTTRNQKEALGKQTEKRPGALKRPARSESRGRKAVEEAPYELPNIGPQKGKRRRKLSVAPSVKPGPTRQKMQSVSVKERVSHKSTRDPSPMPSNRISMAIREVPDPSPGRGPTQHNKLEAGSSHAESNNEVRSHVKPAIPSKSAKVSKGVNTQQSKTVLKPPASRPKAGSSQAQAITIEPDEQLSSSPSPQQNPTQTTAPGHTDATPGAIEQDTLKEAKTPVMLPSSPPGSERGTSHALVSDKPTIIAFGKHGPRNQGVSSTRKRAHSVFSSGPPSPRGNAFIGAQHSHIDDIGTSSVTKRFQSDIQAQGQSRKVPLELSARKGLSVADENTSQSLVKDGKETIPTKLLGRPVRATNSLTERSGEPGQPQDDDVSFAINDFEGPTLINDDNGPTNQRTASQIAMPPPSKIGKKASKGLIPDDQPAHVPAKTAKGKSLFGALKHVRSLAENSQDSTAEIEAVDTSKSTTQRPQTKTAVLLKEQLTQKPVDRKRKHEQNRDPETVSVSKKAKPSQPSCVSIQAVIHPLVPSASQLAHYTGAFPKDSTKRAERRRNRTSRRTTEAFPGVDILGSPYPRNLDVPTQATALEAFSHQAGLSSDEVVDSDEYMIPELKFTTTPKIEPSAGVEPVALPDSSKAVSRIAADSLAQQLLSANRVPPVNSDPFTRNPEHVAKPSQESCVTEFEQALHRQGISNHRESSEVIYGQDEDADVTLVQQNLAEDIETPQSAGSSSHVSVADAASRVLEDVGDWRNTLKPHQTHLFDSLVVAAHKLVRHIVDKETAQADIIADYHRRGNIIVKELQEAHAREYQHYFQTMEAWKKRAADELAAQSRELRQKAKEVERVRAEMKKAKRSWSDVEETFGELLAGLS